MQFEEELGVLQEPANNNMNTNLDNNGIFRDISE